MSFVSASTISAPRETAAHAAIQQEWAIGLGRRLAQGRLAHFLCELSVRLGHSDSSKTAHIDFLLTQRDLADILGLSTVHINRSLQTMRSLGLIELSRKRLIINDKDRLYRLGDFDPAYLHRSTGQDRTISDSLVGIGENASR